MSNVSLDGVVRGVVEDAIRNGDFDELLKLRTQKLNFRLVPVEVEEHPKDVVVIADEPQVLPAKTVRREPYARTAVEVPAQLVTVTEAAKMANVTIKAVYNALKTKKLRGKKILAPEGVQRRGPHGGKITVIPVDSIKAWAGRVGR